MGPGSHRPSAHDQDERSPLLEAREDNMDSSSSEDSIRGTEPPPRALLYIALLLLLIAFLEGGGILQAIPLNQVFEDIICRKFRERSALQDPGSCGDDKAVQAELTLLKGWGGTIGLLPGLLVAVPYGFAADKYGHKVILFLSVFGIILSTGVSLIVCQWPDVFPIRLIWVAPVFTLIGGGPAVFTGMIFSMLSNLCTEEYRSTVFFSLGAVTLVSGVLMSFLASWLMSIDVWLPIWIGFVGLCCCLIIAAFVPETLSSKSGGEATTHSGNTEESAEHSSDATKTNIWSRLKNRISQSKSSIAFFAHGNKHVVMLLLTLLATSLGTHSQDILLQFARKKYGWSWSQAGYLVTLQALIALSLYGAILPVTSFLVTKKFSIPVKLKDLWMARTSCFLLALGVFITGLSNISATMIIGKTKPCM
ncbi:MFS transporter [Colletotrichum truncatum]|uniref:MFS transporter n=1 Tax=Colletotrichum truncatum TaxID=5467 RepID=A0ACC3Z2S5_COLTU